MGQDESSMSFGGPPKALSERSLAAVAEYVKTGRDKRIVVLTGAGISTAAGIPDFRSPKTGLYANLARLNLPYAEAVFDISYFRSHPEPFYVLANELYPGKFHPTVSHAFIALLARKGLLQMLFTQNIDCLERAAGVPPNKIIEAHGSFATQRCVECKTEFPDDKMKEHVFGGKVPHCGEPGCNGLVKPDIVFFGEPLPKAFDNNVHNVAMADLVLIIGTSLTVYPFAALPGMAQEDKPRVLFNMERVGMIGNRPDDVIELGACDDGIRKLADALGWRDELERLWRDTVGDEEAERQLRGRKEDEVEDEVERLAAEVEAVAINDDTKADTKEDASPETEPTKEVDGEKPDNVVSYQPATISAPAPAPAPEETKEQPKTEPTKTEAPKVPEADSKVEPSETEAQPPTDAKTPQEKPAEPVIVKEESK
ncbi:Deacetylase sirtuin-type domain-containing protein [Fusarium falciforme]|uniref:Deacetylase sirtuin-type domain-containing protein n=1 Tax=Fusarium falciforme TaxID=195108 RepID=UPI002301E064|nr:Deacetylase sirtuin-type domain-containing protein [Fusarium falciforme]WAO89902.1 Deacetylase sirtuin-type domain-containing protein [Fusarium falciforme]